MTEHVVQSHQGKYELNAAWKKLFSRFYNIFCLCLRLIRVIMILWRIRLYVPTHLSIKTKTTTSWFTLSYKLTAVWIQTEHFDFHERWMKSVYDRVCVFCDFVFTHVAYFGISICHHVPRLTVGSINLCNVVTGVVCVCVCVLEGSWALTNGSDVVFCGLVEMDCLFFGPFTTIITLCTVFISNTF